MEKHFVQQCSNCKIRWVEIYKSYCDDFEIDYKIESISLLRFIKQFCDNNDISYAAIDDHMKDFKTLVLESSKINLKDVENLEQLCKHCLEDSIDNDQLMNLIDLNFVFF